MTKRLGFKIGDPFITGTSGASFKVTVVTPTMITHRDWGWQKNPWSAWSHIQMGDGTLTAQSREEVARITRRLGGRMKP